MDVSYQLGKDGSFDIANFAKAKPFANFFPGVAGLYGVPMWVFFVNRGQGIASFGIESKDKAILEFQPANKSYRQTSVNGFRTFIKVNDGGKERIYEPFANPLTVPYKTTTRMSMTSHDLTIEEINTTLGLKVTVNYFTMPHESYAALVRRVTLTNIGKKKLSIDMIDGLPAINPFGLGDWLSKHMSRTVEAWMTVQHATANAPFYQLKVVVADTPQVTHIKEGNFYFAFDGDTLKLLPAIVENAVVFGAATDFLCPEKFVETANFTVPDRQETTSRTPSALSLSKFILDAGKTKDIISLSGFVHDLDELKAVVKQSTKPGFIDLKAKANEELINTIKNYCFTHSASKEFDMYCGQTFLDNILRGGLPVSLATAQGPAVFNVYSRKHGDLERDYNFFTLSPTFLSQGNGNYRDVNQNRRNDVFFNTDVRETAVVAFMNLIQADGYNPLVVKGTTFAVTDENKAKSILKEFAITEAEKQVLALLTKGFMPGDLLKFVTRDVHIKGKPDDFLNKVLAISRKQEAADPGEGFWTDHWTYNLDLIQSYLSIYPEQLAHILTENNHFHFYYSDFYTLPRDKRYCVTERGVRQYHSLEEHDKNTQAKAKGYKLRVKAGQGDVYHTNLLIKLVALILNKAAALDPSGIGIEMEANKPNWYDALNGLPGLLGSSISETFEVERFAKYTLFLIDEAKLPDTKSFPVFNELADFLEGMGHILSTNPDSLAYWHKANDLKEHYRHLIRYGIEGGERQVKVGDLKKVLKAIMARCEQGIAKAKDAKGLFATYFYHEVASYDVLDKSHQGEHHAKPKTFKRHDLPFFLEGFVHALRVASSPDVARELHKAVKQSALYDKKLGMYKVNANLAKETEEIGRTRVFPSGWLENESIWLHMEYKYLLELLRSGLVKEFYQEIETCFVPFMKPETYGRSILENSSFIASSAHEDKNLHGQGFVARLSGSTAEFLHMWLIMTVGEKPFIMNQGELALDLKPVLPGKLFTQKADEHFAAHTFACKMLSKTLLVYHNAKHADTFGPHAVGPVKITLKYAGRKALVEVSQGVLKGQQAQDVRDGLVERIDVVLG